MYLTYFNVSQYNTIVKVGSYTNHILSAQFISNLYVVMFIVFVPHLTKLPVI